MLHFLLPTGKYYKLREYFVVLKQYQVQQRQKNAISRIKKKEVLNVCFFLIHESVWKYDGVYQLMLKDKRFNPIIVVCPYVVYGDETMYKTLESTYISYESKGYNIVNSYDNGVWLDVKLDLKPDIVFFTNPHDLTLPQYYIENYKDILTCYVPYNFGNTHLNKMMYNQNFHNVIWKLFAETEIHKKYSINYSDNNGRNVVVSGYPATDIYFKDKGEINFKWKSDKKELKKVIWAPHHTIDDDVSFLSFSSFLMYYNVFFELAEEYKDKIQFIFKPHPLLLNKLYSQDVWGKEKTGIYYEKWNNLENGMLVLGRYEEMFITSDAMIHDSGSFLIEYLCVNKPVLHTSRDKNVTDRMNSFGKMAYGHHYHARSVKEIRSFLEMILMGDDPLKTNREAYIKEYLVPPNGKSASENILEEIVSVLY